MITQTMNLNLIPGQVKPRFNISQFDTGSRTLRFLLYNGSQAFNLATGMTVRIEGIKPDLHGFSYFATITAGTNRVEADLTEQMSCVYGDVDCELVLLQGSQRLGTLNFVLTVEKAPLNADTDMSETDIPAIIEAAEKQLEECIECNKNSEAWARGTKAGVPVTSEDEQYHNNSRYYAQEAADSAEASQKSAEDSQDSAEDAEAWAIGQRNGTAVPSSDRTYHNNSKYYAEQSDLVGQAHAEDSEAWAVGERDGVPVTSSDETYHNNSKYYAEQADSVGQSHAEDAEAWAVGERNGVAVPSTDDTYENNSKYYAEEAADSQAAALLSEQNAKASEDILNYYVTFVIPRFIIQNNRLYMSDAATGEFIVANNRLYIKNPS